MTRGFFAASMLLVLAVPALAQTVAARPEFEVASIKPNTSGTRRVSITGALTGDRFAATNVTLRMLITIAYDVKNYQISGGPALLDSDRYDIEAKPAESKSSQSQSRLRLQTLLEDRFKLAVHRETKEMPVYALMPGKNAAKLAASSTGSCFDLGPGSPPPTSRQSVPCGGMMIGPNTLMGGKITMPEFVADLSSILGRPVIDMTGYTGTFSARLEFTPEGNAAFGPGGFGGPPGPPLDPGNAANNVDSSRLPSIFTAIQEQLGLKLESQKGAGEILVIDRAEKASEN